MTDWRLQGYRLTSENITHRPVFPITAHIPQCRFRRCIIAGVDRRFTILALPICILVLTLLGAGCSPTEIPEESSQINTPTLFPNSPTPSSVPSQIFSPTSFPATATFTPEPSATAEPTITSTPTITPLPAKITDEFDVPMVLVPAGPFLMGSDDRGPNERPAHTVTLDDFYIDMYEATNASFAEFLNVMGNQFEGNAHWIEVNDPDLRVHEVNGSWQVDKGFENYPMNEVTWYGARAYCQWRGAHLPAEAEWEKAARGTDGRTFPWGEDISCELANYAGCVHGAVPVDSYPDGVSPYGVYNMAGNVMEWVADWYDREYYARSPSDNPTGPESGDFKIFRGGSWINAAGNVRTTYRFAKLQVLTYVANGFRCARNAYP